MRDRLAGFIARALLVIVVISAVLYKNTKRFAYENKEWTLKYVKDHPAVEETLTVALFIGGIAGLLSLAIPGSHLLVGVLY